jgi:hypothetical protein
LTEEQFTGKNGQGIKLLERAFALAGELGDGDAGFLIERAFDECLLESKQTRFRPRYLLLRAVKPEEPRCVYSR